MLRTIEKNHTHLIEAHSWGYQGNEKKFLQDAASTLLESRIRLGDWATAKAERESRTILLIARPYCQATDEQDTWHCCCGHVNEDCDFCVACGRHYIDDQD